MCRLQFKVLEGYNVLPKTKGVTCKPISRCKEVGVHSTLKRVGCDAVKSDETERANIIYLGGYVTICCCAVRACTEGVGDGK